MDATPDADTEMLRLVLDGDLRGAAALLVRRHADEVYGLCRAMTRDPVAAEDLSQDVFGRAFAALGEFRGEASPRTWLLRIARNRCIDHLRALRRRPWNDEPTDPDGEATDEPAIDDLLERRADVSRALDALVEGERALVVLRFGHGLAYPELADAFGLKEGTVRMRISRAVAKMRAELEPPAPAALAAPSPAPRSAIPEEAASAPLAGAPAAPARPPSGAGRPAPPASPVRRSRARAEVPGDERSLFDRLLRRGSPTPPTPSSTLGGPAPKALRARLQRMLGAL